MAYSILVADDSEIIRGSLERVLKLSGLPLESILLAENGNEALEKLKTNWVDALITDIHMPGMDGVTLVSKMKESPLWRDIPILVVTSDGSPEKLTTLKKSGVDAFLRKPYQVEQIRDSLVDILGE